MRQESIAARREYHAQRSAQEKRAADAAGTTDVAQRHRDLHRLHELKCVELCCLPADQSAHELTSVKSAPHRVILEAAEATAIELSPEQAIVVAELMIAKAAEACGDGMLADEMKARKRRAA